MNVGDKLRQLRESRNLQPSDIAEVIGKTRQGYGHYETGIREPSIETVVALAKFYGVTTDYILGVTDGSQVKVSKGNETTVKIIESFMGLDSEKKQTISQWLAGVVQALNIEVKPLSEDQQKLIDKANSKK